MDYIVLSEDQRLGLISLRDAFSKNKWQEEVKKTKEDFNPIEIKEDKNGGKYILPLSCVENPTFKKLYDYILANKTTEIVIRDVKESEFIV